MLNNLQDLEFSKSQLYPFSSRRDEPFEFPHLSLYDLTLLACCYLLLIQNECEENVPTA